LHRVKAFDESDKKQYVAPEEIVLEVDDKNEKQAFKLSNIFFINFLKKHQIPKMNSEED
jgi:hypothetical protein